MVRKASYNERGQMSSIGLHRTPASGPSRLLTLGLGYGTAVENNGNVRSVTVSAGSTFNATQVYEYDAVNRLKTAVEGTAWKQTFGYDRFGNRWIEGAPADTFGIASPGAATNAGAYVAGSNRLSGVPHDWAGNASVGGQKMTYDVENRLVKTESTGGWERRCWGPMSTTGKGGG